MSIMRRETTGAGACFRARVDPLGLRPLFVRRIKTSGDGSIVSCRIGELVRADDTIDPLGLATLLTLGFPLADRTLWCEIRRVEAGEQVDASTGGRVGLLHAIQPQQRPPTDDELHEVFMEALRTSIGSNAPIVLLSGGRDSRLIYLGLRALGIRPRTMLTSGRFGASADARVAARLASAFGDPIEEVPLAPFSMETELWRHRAQSFESLEHGWFLSTALRARALGGMVTDGIGLGVLPTGSLMKAEAIALWRSGKLDELANWTVKHSAGVGDEFLDALREARIPLASSDEVRGAIVDALRRLAHLPNPLGAFSLFHWTRRGISASAFGLLDADRTIAPLTEPTLAVALLAEDVECAAASDWRERLLRRMDPTGIPFADQLPIAQQQRRRRSPYGALAWRRFTQSAPPQFFPVIAAASQSSPAQRSFPRAALGLLAASGLWNSAQSKQ